MTSKISRMWGRTIHSSKTPDLTISGIPGQTRQKEPGDILLYGKRPENEKIDKLIDKRNAYITNGGPFPLYRRDPRFTLLELRIVNGARSEGVKINGKVPDLRDCFIAYNNFPYHKCH